MLRVGLVGLGNHHHNLSAQVHKAYIVFTIYPDAVDAGISAAVGGVEVVVGANHVAILIGVVVFDGA